MRKRNFLSYEENFFISEGIAHWKTPDKHDIEWYQNYLELVKFYKQHKHTRVTAHKELPVKFRSWVNALRHRSRRDNMPEWRKDLLNRLEFEFELAKPNINHPWEVWYVLLCDYYKKNNHTKVPGDYVTNGLKLGKWVNKQRQKKNKLNEERRLKLEAINFIWQVAPSPVKRDFYVMLNKLKAFINEEESFNWKKLEKWDRTLYFWLVKRRNKRSILPLNELEELEKLGFPFITKPPEKEWIESFEEYKKWLQDKSQFTKEQWIKLKNWTNYTRTQRRKGKLTEEQISLLESINFQFEFPKDHWDLNIKKLKKYLERYKVIHMPHLKEYDPFLNAWVTHTRYNRKMSEEQRKQLADIGFTWDLIDTNIRNHRQMTLPLWMEKYNKLEIFYKENGHVKIKWDSNLYDWLRQQKYYYKNNVLHKDRQELLEKLGVVFEKEVHDLIDK